MTKSPPLSASTPAIACAFSRRSASPVRITEPVSISSGLMPGGCIRFVDDAAERSLVDAARRWIGRERDRRLEQRLARNHVIAAGEVLSVAPQIDAREDHLRARRADVDADASPA